MIDILMMYLVCSYALGWAMVGLLARRNGIVDLCQFVQQFFWAPLVLALIFIILEAILPNIWRIAEALGIVLGACIILGVFGVFVLKPTVGKIYGVAKPFSEKICVVMYREEK